MKTNICKRKLIGGGVIKKYVSTIILAAALVILSVVSLFIGVIDTDPGALLTGNPETVKLFLISRVPRLLAILCTGIGLSTAGLIMQKLCMNKFVSPSTGATISSAQLGILLALVFLRIPHCGAERLLHLWQRYSEHGFLYGLSSTFSSKIWYSLRL